MKNTLDKEIVDRILQNDKSAFIDLINRYKNKGFSLSMKILKNKEDAEEALQDSFIRVFNALNNFNWNSSFLLGSIELFLMYVIQEPRQEVKNFTN